MAQGQKVQEVEVEGGQQIHEVGVEGGQQVQEVGVKWSGVEEWRSGGVEEWMDGGVWSRVEWSGKEWRG